MPSARARRYRAVPAFSGSPVDGEVVIRHFPGLGVLSKVMQARAMPIRGSSQPYFAGELIERDTNCRSPQPSAVFGHQKIVAAWLAQDSIALVGVLREHVAR